MTATRTTRSPVFGRDGAGSPCSPARTRKPTCKPGGLGATDTLAPTVFAVSIKGVLYEGGRVVLLENERREWELPGGRLEPGETPEGCLAREVGEELGIGVEVGPLLDCWVYHVLPQRQVVIVTYGLRR